MSAQYPGAIRSFTNPTSTDQQTSPSHSAQHADANDEIHAIETTLGVSPQGASGTVRARLDAVDSAVSARAKSADLATVATTGAYSDVTGKPTTFPPTIGTTASTAMAGNTSVASAAQGAKADSAVQPARKVSAGTGLTGGGDLSADRTLAVSFGTAAGTAAQGNDSRLSNARTPTSHAASHKTGGTDALTPTDIGAVPGSVDDGAQSISLGPSASTSGANATALGRSASAAAYGVAVGRGAVASGSTYGGIAIGPNVSAADREVRLGGGSHRLHVGAVGGQSGGWMLGPGAQAGTLNSVAVDADGYSLTLYGSPPVIVLSAAAAVPAGTPAGTVIVRTP